MTIVACNLSRIIKCDLVRLYFIVPLKKRARRSLLQLVQKNRKVFEKQQQHKFLYRKMNGTIS